MAPIIIDSYRVSQDVAGRILVEHDRLTRPIEVPRQQVLRVIRGAIRASLDLPGRVNRKEPGAA